MGPWPRVTGRSCRARAPTGSAASRARAASRRHTARPRCTSSTTRSRSRSSSTEAQPPAVTTGRLRAGLGGRAERAGVVTDVLVHVRRPVRELVPADVGVPAVRDPELRELIVDRGGLRAPGIAVAGVDPPGVLPREVGVRLDQRQWVARREVRAEAEICRRVALRTKRWAVRADRAPDAREVERELHR